jgi:hypothetical protein
MPKDVENLKDQFVLFAKRIKTKILPASGAPSGQGALGETKGNLDVLGLPELRVNLNRAREFPGVKIIAAIRPPRRVTEVYEGAIFSLFLGKVSIGFERFSDAADCLRGHEVVMVVGRSQVGVWNVIGHERETLEHGIVHAGAL